MVTATYNCANIKARLKGRYKQREDTNMVAFIAAAPLIVNSANMRFQQGQANPDVKSFFQSDSHIVHDTKYVD
jgi:hypothetical protein